MPVKVYVFLFRGNLRTQRINDMRDDRFKIRMPLFPGRPAFVTVFQVNNNKIFVC